MLPLALSYGISYHDYWEMTIREISGYIKQQSQKEKALLERREKHELICAAYTAYHAGYFSRVRTFPSTLSEAFPNLFEEPEAEQSADAGERAFLAWAALHNARLRKEESSGNGNN